MIYFEMKIGEPQEVKIMRAKDEGKVNKNVTTEEVARIAQATVDAQEFKTINGEDIRGTGNIEIQGGGGTAGVNSINGQSGDLKLKTINNNDLLGEGNIEIQGGGGDVTSVNGQKGDVVIDIPKKTSQLQNDSKFITNANTIGGVNKIWQGSQAEYDAIENKDSGTLYIIL